MSPISPLIFTEAKKYDESWPRVSVPAAFELRSLGSGPACPKQTRGSNSLLNTDKCRVLLNLKAEFHSQCYSLICIEQFYLANDIVYVLYISCIIFLLLCCNASVFVICAIKNYLLKSKTKNVIKTSVIVCS